MYCEKCGKEYQGLSCPECAKLDNEEAERQKLINQPDPNQNAAQGNVNPNNFNQPNQQNFRQPYQTQQGYNQPNFVQPQYPVKKKSKTGLIVGIVVAVILVAGISSTASKNKKSDDSSTKNAIVAVNGDTSKSGKNSIKSDDKGDTTKEETKPDVSITEQVLWETDGIKVTATGISEDELWGKQIDVLVENTSDKNVGICADAVIVNDYMISDLTSIEVGAGKKTNDKIRLFSSSLEAAGIDNIGKVELYLHTYDKDTYKTIEKSDCITIETSLADSEDTSNDISGTTLYDKDGIKIVGKYVDEDSFWGTSVLLYIENNSDKNIVVTNDTLSVNGFTVSSILSCDVFAGKKAVTDITIFQDDLDTNKITSVDEIETDFRILDENYSEIATSGPVSFSTK